MADLQRLWAPWRHRYLTHRGRRRCFLCAAARSASDRRHRVIARGGDAFAMLNLYPYNNGHVLIAPRRHIGRLERLTVPEWTAILRMSQRLVTRLRARLGAHGFNLGINLGRTAGAGIPGHVHLHIVPRWLGDTNFMPVVAKTKIVSQSLDELFRLLTRPPRRGR